MNQNTIQCELHHVLTKSSFDCIPEFFFCFWFYLFGVACPAQRQKQSHCEILEQITKNKTQTNHCDINNVLLCALPFILCKIEIL